MSDRRASCASTARRSSPPEQEEGGAPALDAATRSGRRESRRACRNGGTLEHAQQIAGHASPKTTKLYDRTADTVTVDEIERIVI